MTNENQQRPKAPVPGKSAVKMAMDRLVSATKALWHRVRELANQVLRDFRRRKPVPISYRYLVRELVERFAGHERTPRLVFSSADSLEDSSDTLLLIAHFLHGETGGKVLLLDQTFLEGGVGGRLGYSGEVGLTDRLYEQGVSTAECIRSTANEGVFVFPAGSDLTKSGRALNAQSIVSLLDELEEFDFVLIQQGSVTMDPRYLDFARAADLVLMYVREGQTLVSEYEACLKIFGSYQVRDVGLVMLEADG